MSNNIKGITIEIGGNTGPLDKALKEVNKTSRDLQGELREVNKQLKLDPTNTVLLQQKQKLLSESVTSTKDKLETLKTAESQAQEQFKKGKISEEQYRALQREVIKTEEQLKKLEKEAGKSNATLSKIGESAKKVGDSAGKVSSAMAPATAAIVGTGTAVSMMSMKFEDSMAKVSTISEDTEVPIGDLRKSIMKLSSDTGVASSEIADSVYDAISAGQSTGDAVNFVTSATKLAKAGFAETGQTVDLLSTIMNSYEMKAEDVTRVSNILINTQNKGKISVAEMSASMGKVIPTAKAYGVNLEQVASGYTIMTAKGIKSAEATTYMNSMLNELGKAGTKASDTVKEISGKSFQDLIASGKSVGDILAMMKDHGDKNNLSLADMFGSSEAAKAGMLLANNAGKDFNDTLEGMNNTAGATDQAFDKVSSTTGEKLKRSLNEMKNNAINLGDAIAPIIETIAEGISKIAKKLSELSPAQLDMIVTIGLIIASISPIAKTIQGISYMVNGLTKSLNFLLAHPIIIVIALAVAAIVGLVLVIKHLWETNEEFRTAIINIWEGITTGISNAVTSITTFFSNLGQWIKNTFNQVVTDVSEFFSKVGENISAFFTKAKEGIVKKIEEIVNSIKEIWIKVSTGVITFINDFITGIKTIFTVAFLAIKFIIQTSLTILITIIRLPLEIIKGIVSNIWDAIGETVMRVVNTIKDVITRVWTALVVTTTTWVMNIREIITTVWNVIYSYI